jgi:hypothetical protein
MNSGSVKKVSLFILSIFLCQCSTKFTETEEQPPQTQLSQEFSRKPASASHERAKDIKACNFKSYLVLSQQEKKLLNGYLEISNREQAVKEMHSDFDEIFKNIYRPILPAKEDLSQKSKALSLIQKNIEKIRPPQFVTYDYMAKSADDLLATFLSITHAYKRLIAIIPSKGDVPVLNMITRVYQIRGDRIIAGIDSTLFKQWIQDGAQFKLTNETTKKVESGQMKKSGGLVHAGFDFQINTSSRKMPRLQINWKVQGGEEWLVDLDIDGYKSLNFVKHLSFENSDVRFWLNSYVKKFGDPGFGVSKNGGNCTKDFGDGDEDDDQKENDPS